MPNPGDSTEINPIVDLLVKIFMAVACIGILFMTFAIGFIITQIITKITPGLRTLPWNWKGLIAGGSSGLCIFASITDPEIAFIMLPFGLINIAFWSFYFNRNNVYETVYVIEDPDKPVTEMFDNPIAIKVLHDQGIYTKRDGVLARQAWNNNPPPANDVDSPSEKAHPWIKEFEVAKTLDDMFDPKLVKILNDQGIHTIEQGIAAFRP